jgi:hypothetical protein
VRELEEELSPENMESSAMDGETELRRRVAAVDGGDGVGSPKPRLLTMVAWEEGEVATLELWREMGFSMGKLGSYCISANGENYHNNTHGLKC